MAVPFVYFKNSNTDTQVPVDLTPLIKNGETVTNLVIGTVQPGTTPALVATLVTAITEPSAVVLLQGGINGMSYGFNMTVTTTARVFQVTCAVTAQDPSFVPYLTKNPEAFTDLVDQIEAGSAAQATTMYVFPAQINPQGGFVTWELLAQDGTVYAAGNAFSYDIQNDGFNNRVVAKSIISVPDQVPPSLNGQRYQIRYTLELPGSGLQVDPTTGLPVQNQFYQFENLRVVANVTTPLGAMPQVEIQGSPATLSLGTDKPYDMVTVELWAAGNQVAPATQITDYQVTSDGYVYSGVFDTTQMIVSLVPYNVIWRYWASNNPGNVFQESADLFIVNASMMGAITDVLAKINKARTTLYGAPDLLYPYPTVMTWLRRGCDAFNAAYGQFTSFTMTNALGPIREFWLLEAELSAIRSQYLAEGEKAFDFQGAAISLNVDRTQYLDNAANSIEKILDSQLKLIKTNMIIKGVTSGPGDADPSRLQPGAIGTVGITITPASVWGRFPPTYGVGGPGIYNTY